MSHPSRAGLDRHIAACNNAVLPGGRLRFHLAGHPVGWVKPADAAAAVEHGAEIGADGLVLDDAAALPGLARSMADAGLFVWREEAFDVRTEDGTAVLSQIDRGALPVFGIIAQGVHLNGLVQQPDGLHVWLARRSERRLLDPGQLDHLSAGGIPAGLDPLQTLIKEAYEEAGLPEALARSARSRGTITYVMDRPEGLRRDILHCYDLVLPRNFTPTPLDGEVAGFELWPVRRVIDAVRNTDAFKFNVNLVLIGLFERLGLVERTVA